MDFNIKSGNPEKQRTACVIVGIFESRRLSTAAKAIDAVSKKYLSNLIRRGDMDGNKVLITAQCPWHDCRPCITDRLW